MANKITIDVEARFIDNVSRAMSTASKSADKMSKSVKDANKELDTLSKKNAKPRIGADDNAFTKKIRQAQSKAEKLGRTKVSATLGAIDKASSKIGQVTGAARAFGSKAFRATISAADKASSIIGNVTGAAKSFAGRTFTAAVRIKDFATAPLRKLKESLFSIKSLVMAITAGFAAKQFVMNPISLADSYSSAHIGFSTLLGEDRGQKMMDDLDVFAKATPFKSAEVISQSQRMIAMGWDAENIIRDMTTIGDAAAATGKGEQGLQQIVTALAQIKSKGKLSTEELNQLAEAGVSAKRYIAEGLGYGSGDTGIAKMTKDLEKGAIGSEKALEALLSGMKEYQGMMETTANETVSGLWSQIEDTFEINIFRRWGQGLQDGAKKGFGTIVELLNSSENALENFGDLIYDIGKNISNWATDKLEKVVQNIQEITGTDTFKNASFGDKMKLLWKGVVSDPLAEWWENGGRDKTTKTAGKIGKWMGETLSNAILGLLGVTDLLKEGGVESGVGEAGMSVAQSFAKGFADGFDASVVTDKLVEAISNVWNALPGWAKFLIGSYGAGKAISGIGNVVGGITSIAGGVKGFMGSTGSAMVGGSGLTGKLASLGYLIDGGAAASSLSGGVAALGGAGAVIGGATLVKGGLDLYGAYKAFKAGDDTEGNAKAVSGGTAIAGVATGAAIGTAILPGIGTAIGAGIGGLTGWIGGNKLANNIRTANVESQELKDALEDSDASAEEIAMAMERAAKTKLAERFGDIELTMEEIDKLAKDIVFDEQAAGMKKFAEASATAEKSLQNFQTAASDMDRLNFDMAEHAWKMEFGLEDKLTEDEIAQVKSRVENFIASAQQVVSDQHYKFNAAVEVLLNPVEGKENSSYDQLINDGNSMYAKLQEQLNNLTDDLKVKYNLYLEDGVITMDEQGTLSRIQGKIAEIIEKISNAETEASFEVSKIKFTTGDLSAESFEQFQSSLQTQLASYQTEQEEALTVAISEIKLELEEGSITQDQYDSKLKTLVDNYNTNIENMTARVNSVQLDGISEAFDGVATAEQIQGAIDGVLADGKNPLELTFDDINAHLGLKEDALSEDDMLAFTEVMQSAIESAASGENALKTTAEVDPTFKVSDEANINEELKSHLEEKLGGDEESGTTITPTINADPTIQLEEGAAETLKSDMETTVSSYLTGENSLNTNANAYAALHMYGAEGIALSEETDKGRGKVKSALDTSMLDPFNTTANANVTLNWKITNPSASVSLNSSGSSVTASIAATENYNGGIITGGPQLSWLDEENMGEAVIPFNPSRRSRALQLFAETGRRLGVFNHANGGIVGDDDTPITTFTGGEIQSGGDQKIEVNVGGITIEVKAEGGKSVAESIKEQSNEIAAEVIAILNKAISAKYANTPARGGA